MASGTERKERIKQALGEGFLDALVCALPTNVLMLSGYWPVVGTGVAVATADGRVTVLAPKDEHELAHDGWADEVRTYSPSSLEHPMTVEEAISLPLRTLLEEMGLSSARIGYEDTGIYEASSYSAMYLFQAGFKDVLAQTADKAQLAPAMDVLMRLRAALTPEEVEQVRQACALTGQAFRVLAEQLRPGLTEPEVAVALAAPIIVGGHTRTGGRRAGAFTWCMSGPNSAEAKGAFARSRDRALQPGDFVLVHCNSFQEGYWTDITRTFCLGQPDDRQRAMYDAVFAARRAALDTIKPGVAAAEVDGAARAVLSDRGFGEYFPHPVGHNVGFSVISAEFPPRLRPKSPDHLEPGMTFNIEPAIYIDGYGGLRHCDVVTLGDDGPEVLTPFLSTLDELIIGG